MPNRPSASLQLRRAFRRNLVYGLILVVLAALTGSFVLGLAGLHDIFDGLLHYLHHKGAEWSRAGQKSRRNCVVVPLMTGFTSALLATSVVPVAYFAGRDLGRHLVVHDSGLTLGLAIGDLALNGWIMRSLHGIEQDHAHTSWWHQIGDIASSSFAIVALALITLGANVKADPIAALAGGIVILLICGYNMSQSWSHFQAHSGSHEHSSGHSH